MGDKNYLGTPLPPELKSKIISSLKSNNMISNSNLPKQTFAILGLLLIAAFSCGYFLNTFLNTNKTKEMVMDNKSKFMLILKNTPEFKEDIAHVAEYGLWMSDLVARGIMATGDELDINGTLLGNNQSNPSDLNTISGYFLIETDSESTAIAIANACPHIKHGGQVMIKKVIQH